MLARAWIAAHRARRRLARRPRAREELVSDWAPGRSFLDVGAMWSVHGAIAFAAEAAGARSVTTVDVIGETPEFVSERARRGSSVRHVQGDLHDPAVMERAGVHDVVWCSGVLYHAPSPLLTLERLRAVCGEVLLLSTESLPEVPGLPGACVFYPALDERARAAYRRAPGGRALGVTEAFDASQGYGNWFWGITPSALSAMLDVAGFDVTDLSGGPFHLTAIARPRRSPPAAAAPGTGARPDAAEG